MPLPDSIRVKLSSEEAGFASITPVVSREIPTRELIDLTLGVTGKDPERVREILLRGTLVSGGSRFRWAGWESDRESIETVLATFPDADPSLPFATDRCVRAVLRGPSVRIDLPREAGARRRVLRRRSYWDMLMSVAAGEDLRYAGYSYSEHADWYRMTVSSPLARRLREDATLLNYSALARRLQSVALESVDFYTERIPR